MSDLGRILDLLHRDGALECVATPGESARLGFLAISLANAIPGATIQYTRYAFLTQPGAPFSAWIPWFGNLTDRMVYPAGLATLALLLIPDGRFVSPMAPDRLGRGPGHRHSASDHHARPRPHLRPGTGAHCEPHWRRGHDGHQSGHVGVRIVSGRVGNPRARGCIGGHSPPPRDRRRAPPAALGRVRGRLLCHRQRHRHPDRPLPPAAG
jgi:hypothetical protein